MSRPLEFSVKRFLNVDPAERWRLLQSVIEEKRRELERLPDEALEGFFIYLEGRDVYFVMGLGLITRSQLIREVRNLLRGVNQPPH